jgi:hypothetical protein
MIPGVGLTATLCSRTRAGQHNHAHCFAELSVLHSSGYLADSGLGSPALTEVA